jgi:superfamily II helicase
MSSARRKVCRQCGFEKAIRLFYRHSGYADGHMNICKVCHRANVDENKLLKCEQYRQRSRERDAHPDRVAKRKAYAMSPRGRAAHRAAQRRYMRFRRLEAATAASSTA